jgi:flavin-binding protein dodecin
MTACMVREVRGNLSDIPSMSVAVSQALATATDLIDRADWLKVINISLGYK